MNLKKYIIGLLLLMAFMWLLGYFIGDYFHGETEATKEDEWCEVGEINSRGELVYSQDYAGETDFLVLATSQGPKLLAKCK